MQDKCRESIAKERLVLMCGISGSGKTVFSKKIEEMGYVRIAADEISWEINGGDFTALPWESQQKIFSEVNRKIDGLIASHLARGEKIVVDSTMCKRARRDHIRSLAAGFDVRPLVVYLPSDYATLRSRLEKRRGSGPNDIIISDTQLGMFCRNFEVPAPDEHPVIISIL